MELESRSYLNPRQLRVDCLPIKRLPIPPLLIFNYLLLRLRSLPKVVASLALLPQTPGFLAHLRARAAVLTPRALALDLKMPGLRIALLIHFLAIILSPPGSRRP